MKTDGRFIISRITKDYRGKPLKMYYTGVTTNFSVSREDAKVFSYRKFAEDVEKYLRECNLKVNLEELD